MSRRTLRRPPMLAAVLAAAAIMWLATLLVVIPQAQAVPAFARRYGMACSGCHSAWPALNDDGWSFKMSGYRQINGKDLEPTTKDIEVGAGALTIPSIPPLAIEAFFGFDFRRDRREASAGTTATRTGSSLDLEGIEMFAAAPLGKHLSVFLDFPMFETHAEALNGPTGPGEANATTGADARRAIAFQTESPVFEKGKLIWVSLLPESVAPPGSLNLVAGADQLPTPFSAEANRLSVNPYLIYRRRAVDLLSSVPTEDLLSTGNEADRLVRLGEPQIQVALNGILVPGGKLIDLAKPKTVAFEYHVGVTNGSNVNGDPNTEKDLFARLAVRWYGQVLGVFGYWSPDIYDDAQRSDGSTVSGPNGNPIFSGRQLSNRFWSVGPDLRVSLEPLDIPVWLEAQVLFNNEHDPTGFKKSFGWWGGFSQIYVKPVQSVVAYARYDWLRGDHFDDTGVGGATGPVTPREWDAVVGVQWYVLENLKVGPEYSHREFTNVASTPRHQKVTEDFFTIRAGIGF